MAATAAQAATAIRPLITSQQPSAASSGTRFFDRSSARELVRLVASVVPHHVSANLRQEGTVQTLEQPVVLPAAIVGKIVVPGASTLRLRINRTAGVTLWIAGENDESFERVDEDDAAVWTPTTNGSTVYIVSEGAREPVEITRLVIGTAAISTQPGCLQDLACGGPRDVPEVAEASRAIALLRFVRGDASYICTGGLVNDANDSRTPYLLTAQHCISTSEEAASIEAVWDDRLASCGSSAPVATTRTYGAELLVSSASTDVALLRMKKIPANRVFLGVELVPLTDGTPTYRLSHADGGTQKYSAGSVRTTGATCPSAPSTHFIYSVPTAGAVSMGSSGAPLLVPGLRIAGQLLGLCGPSPNEPCAIYNDVVDGSITASWPLLSPYLDPGDTRRRSAHH